MAATFNDLLTQVAASSSSDAVLEVAPSSATEDMDGGAVSCLRLLSFEVPRVVKAAARQLKETSSKTRTAAFHCLRQLVSTLPGSLAVHASALIPGLLKALKDTSNPMRIEALLFLRQSLSSHPPQTFMPYFPSLLPPMIVLADDRYYKTVAEALRVLSEVVSLLRPNPPENPFEYEELLPPVYKVVERRLQSQDQDHEVKEWAIQCMGLLVVHFADNPSVHLPHVLPLLLERTRNEITRNESVLEATFLHSRRSLPPLGLSSVQTKFKYLSRFLLPCTQGSLPSRL